MVQHALPFQVGNQRRADLIVSGSDSSLTIQSGDVNLSGPGGTLGVRDGASLTLPANLVAGTTGRGVVRLNESLTVAGNTVIGRDASSSGEVDIDANQPSVLRGWWRSNR